MYEAYFMLLEQSTNSVSTLVTSLGRKQIHPSISILPSTVIPLPYEGKQFWDLEIMMRLGEVYFRRMPLHLSPN